MIRQPATTILRVPNGSPTSPDPSLAVAGGEPGARWSWSPVPPRSRGPARRPLIVLGVLVPVCFAGWLMWQSADQPTEAARNTPRSLMPLPGGDSGGAYGARGGSGGGGKSLAGKTVLIDPGHNPGNRRHTAEINRRVSIGTGRKECDTTGTATASGYSEAEFTLDLARRVRDGLRERGATVELTHQGRRPWGPCVDGRAEAGNRTGADAVVSLHADGATTGERGFHVILPESVHKGKADTRAIAGPSRNLGRELADSFREFTGSKPAAYAGDGEGTDTRGDLGGLNLTRVPKVLLECGNMRNPQDAAALMDRSWRDRAAHGVVAGISDYLAERR